MKKILAFIIVSLSLIIPKAVFAVSITPSLAANPTSGAVGSDIVVNVKLNPSPAVNAQGYRIFVGFDTSVLHLETSGGIVYTGGFSLSGRGGGDSDSTVPTLNATSGVAVIKLAGDNLTAQGVTIQPSANLTVATLTFKVVQGSQTLVNLLNTSSMTVFDNSGISSTINFGPASVTLNPSVNPSPTPTPTPPAPNPPSITGITGLPATCQSADLTSAQKQAATITWTAPVGSSDFWVDMSSDASFPAATYYHKHVTGGTSTDMTGINLNNQFPAQEIAVHPGTPYFIRIYDTATTLHSQSTIINVPACSVPPTSSPTPSPTPTLPPAPTCPYTSTQVLFRERTQDQFASSGTVVVNQPIFIAGFHNGSFSNSAGDAILTVTDPNFNAVTVSPTAGNNIFSFTPTVQGVYHLSATTNGFSGNNCTGALDVTVGTGATATQYFRVAEGLSPQFDDNIFDPANPAAHPNGWKLYTDHPMTANYTLVSTQAAPLNNGDTRIVNIQFKSMDGAISQTFSKTITYTPDPMVNGGNVDCHLATSGSGTSITVNGSNFGGQKGKLTIGGHDVDTNWHDNSITANFDQTLTGRTPVQITVADGRSTTADCVINTTTVDFTIKTQCKPPGLAAANNVDVKIFAVASDNTNPDPLQQNQINTDKDGVPAGFTPNLEVGKKYELVVKAPGTLARRITFDAKNGTTVLSPIILPVGAIAPANNPHGVVNSLDLAELKRQWGQGSARTADFNGDGVVNSLDWACMRANFGDSDQNYTPQ